MEVVLSYPDTPPSFNAVGHSGSRWKWTKAKKEWQQTMEQLLVYGAVPRRLGRVEARAELTFPTKTKRDVVNYRTLLEKCLGDALVNGGWLTDDTPQYFAFTAVSFEHGKKRMKLFLDCTAG